MKKVFQKTVIWMLCGVWLVMGSSSTVFAQDSLDISLLLDNISTGYAALSFNNNQAACKVVIIGTDSVKKITGTVKLYDETTKKTVQSWQISRNSVTISESWSTPVLSGHKYTLTFIGTVYNADHTSESIKRSVTKVN